VTERLLAVPAPQVQFAPDDQLDDPIPQLDAVLEPAAQQTGQVRCPAFDAGGPQVEEPARHPGRPSTHTPCHGGGAFHRDKRPSKVAPRQ